ncbi:MAG: FecR domain-containing protein [Prevotellaceae bacterium]|jgi:ferric-dicitrate binding protein FerR (iron transport regulator)|nr:FecR domain-containing protein [Prevotellaceae bacterium]
MKTNLNRPTEETIGKVLTGVASEEEATQVAAWLATWEGERYLSQSMEEDLARLSKGYEEVAVDHPIPSEAMYSRIVQHIRKKQIRRICLRVAAVLLPLLFVGGIFFQLNSRVSLLGGADYEEVYIPKGERVQFMFQDGSKAYINADSKIRYPKQFGLFNRKIFLEGEAYFVVNPNANRPFVVAVGKTSIQVLGTAFNVSAYPDEDFIHVSLDEGKISMASAANKNSYLNPGEKIIYNKRTDSCTIIRAADVKRGSLWKNDIISFSNASLQEVIKTLNRWYNVPFVVEDARAYAYSYTFTSENTLLEKVLYDFEKIAPVRFTCISDTVRVSMK